MSNKIDVLGLDFWDDFPVCQYWMRHFGIVLGMSNLGMPAFRQNKINVPASQDFLLLVPKWSVFISGLQPIPDPAITQFLLQFHLDLQIYITVQLYCVWKSGYKLPLFWWQCIVI